MDKSFKFNDIKNPIKCKYNSFMKIWYLKIDLLSSYEIIIGSIIAVLSLYIVAIHLYVHLASKGLFAECSRPKNIRILSLQVM